MKYTLITGASGFIGANLIKLFLSKKIKILVKNNKFHHEKAKTINIDISNKNINFNFLKDVETIIHLASISEKNSKKNKKKVKQANYNFIKDLFEQSKKYNVRRIIKISTAKVYGLNLDKRVTEKSKLKPFNDYVYYHAKSDEFLYKNIDKGKLDILILRISNGFGAPKTTKKDCWDLIVNNFCYNAFKNKKITIKSKFNYKKNFIDMTKIIKTIKLFNDYPKKISGIYNIGSEKSFSLRKMAFLVKKMIKSENIQVLSSGNTKIKNNKFIYSVDKVKRLKFKIKDNTNEELKDIIEYLKKNKKNV